MKKSIISIFLSVALIFSLSVNVIAQEEISIYVNETKLECEIPPFIQNGRTMVPMRKIFEALGASVEWIPDEQLIYAKKGYNYIIMQINSFRMTKNNYIQTLDTAPVIVDGTTFVPVRAVSQSLNSFVQWDEKSRSVIISDTEKKVIVYAPDGRSKTIDEVELEDYKSVGWYEEPVTYMYAIDGRKEVVALGEVDAWKNVGWYTGYEPEYVYQRMMRLKAQYPNGMRWTNDDYYEWKGGVFSGGYGCAGFVFILSDAAFDDAPAREIYDDITIDKVRVGDILRINHDTHSVIVLEVHENYVITAEGNYNSSIRWGGKLSKARVESADYILTRYPEE